MYKLLVVDDEKEIRNGICMLFPWNDIGFEVVAQAANAKQAFAIVQSTQIDVVLCDIVMPVMTGVDFAKELSTADSKVKVIFYSGYKNFEYAQKAFEYGVKNYVLKSSNNNELIRIFSKIKYDLDKERSSCAREEAPKPENEESFNEKIISTIKKYSVEHIRTVTLEDLTSQVHMNPFYISKFFKKKTGQNFSDYLIEIRMKKAAKLLDQIEYKIYEISNMVGYCNSFNFTRTFKSYFGITPKEYRNRKTK